MGKIINAYAGFTATDLKNRADIPNQTDIIVNGSTVDCSNISVTGIKNVLGSSSTSVSGLCSDSNVNIWSGFAPTEWYLSGGNFLNRIKTPYTMGNFAGYNHGAIAAGWMGAGENNKPTTFKYGLSDTTKILSGALQGGEIPFNSMINSTHVKWVIKDGANTIATNNLPFSGYSTSNPIIPTVTIDVTSFTNNKTLTSNLYLSNAAGDELCLFPNVSQWNIIAVQKQPATAYFTPSGLGVVGGTATLDLSFQQYTLNLSSVLKDAAHGFAAYTGRLNITAKIYNDLDVLVHTQVITTADSARTYTGSINTVDVLEDFGVEFIVSNYDSM